MPTHLTNTARMLWTGILIAAMMLAAFALTIVQAMPASADPKDDTKIESKVDGCSGPIEIKGDVRCPVQWR